MPTGPPDQTWLATLTWEENRKLKSSPIHFSATLSSCLSDHRLDHAWRMIILFKYQTANHSIGQPYLKYLKLNCTIYFIINFILIGHSFKFNVLSSAKQSKNIYFFTPLVLGSKRSKDPILSGCRTGYFTCEMSGECIESWKQCNGIPDCPNGEDEALAECASCRMGEFKVNV